jgi:hypothetical protein
MTSRSLVGAPLSCDPEGGFSICFIIADGFNATVVDVVGSVAGGCESTGRYGASVSPVDVGGVVEESSGVTDSLPAGGGALTPERLTPGGGSILLSWPTAAESAVGGDVADVLFTAALFAAALLPLFE